MDAIPSRSVRLAGGREQTIPCGPGVGEEFFLLALPFFLYVTLLYMLWLCIYKYICLKGGNFLVLQPSLIPPFNTYGGSSFLQVPVDPQGLLSSGSSLPMISFLCRTASLIGIWFPVAILVALNLPKHMT